MEPFQPEFIIGRILSPRGIKGELRVEVLTDFPQRFAPCSTVYIDSRPMTIESTEWHKDKAVIKIDTINSLADAQRLRGKLIEIHHSQVSPLPEGQYYHFQIIGLEVWTTRGEMLGNVTGILSAKSNDNYVVRRPEGEVLIPAIDDVVKTIDIDRGRIIIEAIEGLLA
ncbi:ribosome maturation factor RimM [Chloroflexota bacterium]